MMMWEAPPIHSLLATLSDPTLPVGMRMRATYYLRQTYDNYVKNHHLITNHHEEEDEKNHVEETSEIVSDNNADADADDDTSLTVLQALTSALSNEQHGSLLRHEFAYVLGQLRDVRAVHSLECTLLNAHDDTMVRHECAEALGAIGSISCIPTLQKVAHEDSSIEVGQTCHLALDFIRWKERKKKGSVETQYAMKRMIQQEVEKDEIEAEEEEEEEEIVVCACMLPPYSSVDPAPPHPKHVALSTSEIGAILRDVNAPLFERFRAMFSLRNRGEEDCVKELGNALVTDESSALLRHEVAYVLGQMQHPHAVEYLACSLERTNEHRMVRHESAEALGAIEERWGECENILQKYLTDEDDVVRESCVVALDAADYWGYNNNQVVEEHDGDDLETKNEIKPGEGKELESINLIFEDGKEEEHRRVNFSIHKAQTNGKTNLRPEGVLQNHFNIAAL